MVVVGVGVGNPGVSVCGCCCFKQRGRVRGTETHTGVEVRCVSKSSIVRHTHTRLTDSGEQTYTSKDLTLARYQGNYNLFHH